MAASVIKDVVCLVRDEMITEGYGDSFRSINQGNCDTFAYRVAKKMRELIVTDSTRIAEQEICDFFVERDVDGGPLNRQQLSEVLPEMIPPDGMSWDELNRLIDQTGMGWGLHVFVVYEGRAYDSETPEGVTSFFDLPFFQRYLARLDDRFQDRAETGMKF